MISVLSFVQMYQLDRKLLVGGGDRQDDELISLIFTFEEIILKIGQL
jgi:hypothetical protein